MKQQPAFLPKLNAIKPAEDFFELRREGIAYIEQAGSKLWTDYNIHDPGITLLEALCYALTDIAYRSGWDISDILALENASSDDPFPDQAFFTAREILTTNPVTSDDFRRVLIDLEPVRNAWVFCKACGCDVDYYAWCENDRLVLSYRQPENASLESKKVEVQGLYDVLLELEDDPELGDLNDRKIKKTLKFYDTEGKVHPLLIELRFPDLTLNDADDWQSFLAYDGPFTVTVRVGATKDYDVLTDPLLDQAGRDRYLKRHWREVFYVGFSLELGLGGETITFGYAALRLYGDAEARAQTTVSVLVEALQDAAFTGFIGLYRSKSLKVKSAVDQAKALLHTVRNLDEDYCRVDGVKIADVAVCADVEVAPEADIDRVQAQIWFAIEACLNPPVPFFSLQELIDAGYPSEAIFNGPALDNGFIKSEDLEQAVLKFELRTSDIVNRLMDIDGVQAVNNLLLTQYDGEGRIVKGRADPVWQADGTPLFEAGKISAAWLLFIDDRIQPRFYREQSRFLFFKNGLPFQARADEALDTLTRLQGEAERPKIKNANNDLPVPAGIYRNPGDYYPLQYGFPLAYGIGPEGLPSHVSKLRRAQARQLKAYLMVFEQFLGNQLAQLAHTADLFSIHPAIQRTYFVREFTNEIIDGYDDLVNGLDSVELEAMTETVPEFLERRNRFLDHLLARFGEQFSEYALLLTDIAGRSKARALLIESKLSFLKVLPLISRDRYRSFNYRDQPCSAEQYPVLKKRVSLLLGYPDWRFCFKFEEPVAAKVAITFELKDPNNRIRLSGTFELAEDSASETQAFRTVIKRMTDPDAYQIEAGSGSYQLVLKDDAIGLLAVYAQTFATLGDAQRVKDDLVGWSANERAILVEHLLLRPKFPGDALYPVCADGVCKTCGDEDPYSFRLTWIMPGWTAPYNVNLELREFAERTIRRETPAHLPGKICWVANNGFIENACDPNVADLAQLLIEKGLTESGDSPDETGACACAEMIYGEFGRVFKAWYNDKTLDYFHPDIAQALLANEFGNINPDEFECSTVLTDSLWSEIVTFMTGHFIEIARYGRQFERFEAAWCRWLVANAAIDWTGERLQDHVEALLRGGLMEAGEQSLCRCAAAILADYGTAFYEWLDGNIKAGNSLDDLTPFNPGPVTLCSGVDFKPGIDVNVKQLLDERYQTYTEVSYLLRIALNLLVDLKNTYPEATLHDCDDGSDDNPVRLDKTALGSLNAVQRPFETL